MLPLLAEASESNLMAARNQMALSLGWHIVLACFGVAFPAMIFVQHRRGLRGDTQSLELAKRWSKAAAVLFAAGAVSGTILSFELGLLWPGLMAPFGLAAVLVLPPLVYLLWLADKQTLSHEVTKRARSPEPADQP